MEMDVSGKETWDPEGTHDQSVHCTMYLREKPIIHSTNYQPLNLWPTSTFLQEGDVRALRGWQVHLIIFGITKNIVTDTAISPWVLTAGKAATATTTLPVAGARMRHCWFGVSREHGASGCRHGGVLQRGCGYLLEVLRIWGRGCTSGLPRIALFWLQLSILKTTRQCHQYLLMNPACKVMMHWHCSLTHNQLPLCKSC